MEKNCGRCNLTFECKHNDIFNCQCSTINLNDEERNFIAEHYQDCLCIDCLTEIKIELNKTSIINP